MKLKALRGTLMHFEGPHSCHRTVQTEKKTRGAVCESLAARLRSQLPAFLARVLLDPSLKDQEWQDWTVTGNGNKEDAVRSRADMRYPAIQALRC